MSTSPFIPFTHDIQTQKHVFVWHLKASRSYTGLSTRARSAHILKEIDHISANKSTRKNEHEQIDLDRRPGLRIKILNVIYIYIYIYTE